MDTKFRSTSEQNIYTISALEEWKKIVTEHMPHLSAPQATVLALWSFGMVISHSCGLTSVSSSLAMLVGEKENSVRQRIREWYYAKDDKRGEGRCELEVSSSFVPLLQWILSWWPVNERRLALAMDATSLGQVLVVLVVSVVYRGCAIPVAWRVLPAAEKGSWKEPWLDLFSHFQDMIPEDWVVIVMADRGLYASWLFEAIQKCKWHPFLRINDRIFFRPKDEKEFKALHLSFRQPGCTWSGAGTCFKTNSLEATLLVQWEEGFEKPWLVLTDLPPDQTLPCWYGLRAWIESGFKHIKSAGWQWQYTRMIDPERATRFWLAIAVATLWVLSVGGEADANIPASSFDALPENHVARRHAPKNSYVRYLSCFHRGIMIIITALIAQRQLPLGRFIPEPWPT
ncbi:MAG TPA: transposase [Anaerolineales bacterium]|nr:transposase [Anaerolineales bacterium]